MISQILNKNKEAIITPVLFIFSILAFSSSWFIIKKQVSTSGTLWPLSLRFLCGSFFLLIYALFSKKKLNISFTKHKRIILQSFLLFSINFIAIYEAAKYLYSGINSLVCATVVMFNIINISVLYKKKIDISFVVSGSLGLVGLSIIIFIDYYNTNTNNINYTDFLIGTALGLIGAYITSCGQVFTTNLLKNGISVIQLNVFGMLYGSIIVAAIALIAEKESLLIQTSLNDISYLLYIALIPTAAGFVFYTKLIKRIGAQKGGYVFIFVPLVAIFISNLVENYIFNPLSCFGIALIILGQVLSSKKKITT
jgi:drug/metabolite transporter (DMT)-like permease